MRDLRSFGVSDPGSARGGAFRDLPGMGAYDSDPRRYLYGGRGDTPPPCIPALEGGGRARNLVDGFSGLVLGDGQNEAVHQIKKAVEDAESTIKQQVAGCDCFRSSNSSFHRVHKAYLSRHHAYLENHVRIARPHYAYESLCSKSPDLRVIGPFLRGSILADFILLRRNGDDIWLISFVLVPRSEIKSLRSSEMSANDHLDAYKTSYSNSSVEHEAERRWVENHSPLNPQDMLVLHQNGVAGREEHHGESGTASQQYFENKVKGDLRKIPGVNSSYCASSSQYSIPSSQSLSPSRHKKEGEQDQRLGSPGNGLVPVSDLNSNILWKQELMVKVREHEEEIAQLRQHLADYSVKEAQICNEKYVLDKRIAYMRMAFDQQQQDLVDAASKAISYRQDIIEENIRLTYALKAAKTEKSTFIASLVPLLSEHDLQPSVVDAHSIISTLKVLFTHMQQKLIIAEEKLKESQYQIAPWYLDASNADFPAQSPSHPVSVQVVVSPLNPHAKSPISSPNLQTRPDRETVGNQNQQVGPSSIPTKNEISTPFMRDHRAQDASGQINASRLSFESRSQNPSSKVPGGSSQTDDPATVANHGKETSVHWAPRSSPYLTTGQDEQNVYPYLPTVLEEPGSSFSEDDDPLPAIDGLQISGDAYPGNELLASGYSINGTTTCNFEWVRYLEDGSLKFIEGAKQPKYLVTADDVDSYLAIEVQPLDDRKRKFKMFLKRKELWNHIDGCVPTSKEGTELSQWDAKDARIISWILGSIEPHMVPKEALASLQAIHEDSRRDQFLMKLRPEFEVARAGLLNRNPVPSLDICLGELLREEQRMTTQAVLGSSKEISEVVNVAYVGQVKNRGKGQMQCYNCKEFGHIARNCCKKFCNYYKQNGHIIKQCPTRPENRRGQAFQAAISDLTTISSTATIAGTNQSFATLEMVQQMIITAFPTLGLYGQGKIVSSPWFVDSGASNHMTGSPDWLHNLQKYTDPEMQDQIERTFSSGNASYEVSLSTRFLDIWETAILAIKRGSYSIKCNGGVVLAEKFQSNTTVSIPYGHPTEFFIQDANANEYLLRTQSSVLRDTIVLTLRLFQKVMVHSFIL
ncbi:hypothetical protein ZIOFF_073595 [Zingiber officinale]|uniref:CCHC-type domain-containing protein n=1 Tax=Zingiber officinale TaxID=94328 RepID=A0A8J5EAD1_ZINOF|nr:hypothetical protein ZIOFF_073595 [Zingiber officinale]